MSQHTEKRRRNGSAGRAALFLVPALLGGLCAAARAGGGPVDLPRSAEPRVPAGKCLSSTGLIGSEGNYLPYFPIGKGDTVHTRDLLVALPGFKVGVEPASRKASLTLWGNLPGLSGSPVRESAVLLHDSRAFDLDFTPLRGRVVLTNTRDKGPARVWLRVQAGVQLTLPEPGDSVALEIYGRWPAGVGFSRKNKDVGPLTLWEVHCLKGSAEVKAHKTEWTMSAAPGLAYFHGDSSSGPAPGGPERRPAPPDWADPKEASPRAAVIKSVVEAYSDRLTAKESEGIPAELLALAAREADAPKARALRQMAIYAMAALDEPEKVAELLGESPSAEERRIAVGALRHWTGGRRGRPEKLDELLQNELHFGRGEAEALLQLLHSPFDRNHADTYETLISYLRHRKQAVRELAHWHLVRLAPAGRGIAYDAAAPAAERNKAVAAWKKLIPDGELPPEKTADPKPKAEK